MQVLVTWATSIEEQLANMMATMEKLTKTVEKKDMQIAELKSILEAQPEEDSTKGPHGNDKGKEKQGETSSRNLRQLRANLVHLIP
jgi:hypothetical protein